MSNKKIRVIQSLNKKSTLNSIGIYQNLNLGDSFGDFAGIRDPTGPGVNPNDMDVFKKTGNNWDLEKTLSNKFDGNPFNNDVILP